MRQREREREGGEGGRREREGGGRDRDRERGGREGLDIIMSSEVNVPNGNIYKRHKHNNFTREETQPPQMLQTNNHPISSSHECFE